MSVLRRSIASRILLPVLVLAAVTVAGMLILAGQTTRRVRDDYDRFALGAASAHVSSILDIAASELTAARLGGTPVVVAAKKRTVSSALQAYWDRSGLDGIVLSGSDVVLSTLSPEATRAVISGRGEGFFTVESGGERLRALADTFAPWDWTVVTVAPRTPFVPLRPELRYLLPALALAALVLALGVVLVLWRNLHNPVARMVEDVEADREVRPTALLELDRIGAAVNSAVARLRVRTRELAEELELRRRMEEVLQRKEARIRLLLESTAEGIFGIDRAGVCTFCNPAALRLLGYRSEAEVLGRHVHRLAHHSRPGGEAYPEHECPILATSGRGEAARVTDERFWRPDGTSFPVEYWSYPMLDGDVQVGAVVGFIDTTERATLEQQLRQAQKLEAVGRLAGGIAHDFNNMLMAIVGHASLAREAAVAGSPVEQDLEQVLAAADRAAALTRQILAFSRRQPMSLGPVDVNETVLGMGKVVARLLGEDVEVVYRLAGGKLVVLADRGQLEQVLLNLWTNARDAMPEGGRLTIGTQGVSCDAQAAAALGLDGAGRFARITVGDTGVGMDEQTRHRIFEPFFTTKEAGKGTGLGLSIVYGIVKQHRGHIAVVSAPGQGTTFDVYLPVTLRAAAAETEGLRPEARAARAETVLLAEDNDAVRELARSVLERAGYRVVVARDGQEALELAEQHAAEIALCLFDVVMPRLGGREALEVLRAHRPELRALLMSGYAPAVEGPIRLEPDPVPLLPKPFTPRELLRRIRETLDGSAAPPPSA